MTAQELIERLQRMKPETEIVVAVNVPYDSIGPSPRAMVTQAFSGFDWDSGTLRLSTEGNLVKFNDEQFAAFQQMKKEARKTRSDAWHKLGGRNLSWEDCKALEEQMDKDVHPLFKGSYNKD